MRVAQWSASRPQAGVSADRAASMAGTRASERPRSFVGRHRTRVVPHIRFGGTTWRKAGCASTELITFARGETPARAAPAARAPEAIAAWDDNRNGRVSCAEARAHGIAPVTRDHPAYPFMRDGDADGVVCESSGRRAAPTGPPASPRASGAGCGRTATARPCGEIIPMASRVAIARISGAWIATTTAGLANGRVVVVAGGWKKRRGDKMLDAMAGRSSTRTG